jgi:hypothetical protein
MIKSLSILISILFLNIYSMDLIGIWHEDTTNGVLYLSYEFYSDLVFTQDSFYLTKHCISDVITANDPYKYWIEDSKGKYSTNGDSLFLTGVIYKFSYVYSDSIKDTNVNYILNDRYRYSFILDTLVLAQKLVLLPRYLTMKTMKIINSYSIHNENNYYKKKTIINIKGQIITHKKRFGNSNNVFKH